MVSVILHRLMCSPQKGEKGRKNSSTGNVKINYLCMTWRQCPGNNNNNQQKKNNPINLKLINIKLQRTICHMTACLHISQQAEIVQQKMEKEDVKCFEQLGSKNNSRQHGWSHQMKENHTSETPSLL